MTELTADRLKTLFTYSPETGVFVRRINCGPAKAGQPAGTVNVHGYVQISVDNRIYRRNRLAWFYTTGAWPKGVVDHIDGDKANDAWANLRDITQSQNAHNIKGAHADKASSRLLGITRNGSGWMAQIWADGQYKYLGTYRTPEEANAVYVSAKRELHTGCTI